MAVQGRTPGAAAASGDGFRCIVCDPLLLWGSGIYCLLSFLAGIVFIDEIDKIVTSSEYR